MKNLIKTGRIFYGICLIGLGLQQTIYSDFIPVILPKWPDFIPEISIWASLTGIALIFAGLIIIFYKKAKNTALVTGACFLLFFVIFQLSYLLFVSPDSMQLGLWTNAFKELSFAGGAFIVAGSFSERKFKKKTFHDFLKKWIPLGSIFFSIMLILFGIDHFLYTQFVATLIPAWIPAPVIWTYVAGSVLIIAGLAILFKIKIRLVALILGIMLLIWLVSLHIPRALADPVSGKGNEITSAFEALAFSGMAFILAGTRGRMRAR